MNPDESFGFNPFYASEESEGEGLNAKSNVKRKSKLDKKGNPVNAVIDERLETIKNSYHTAKLRSSEYLNGSNLVLPLKIHGKNAGKVYSALSTLLYASICISKADQLENFIRKKATQLPVRLYCSNINPC